MSGPRYSTTRYHPSRLVMCERDMRALALVLAPLQLHSFHAPARRRRAQIPRAGIEQ